MRDDFDTKGNGSIPDNLSGFYSGFYTGGKRIMRYGKNKSNRQAPFGQIGGSGYRYGLYDHYSESLNDDSLYDPMNENENE